MLKKLTNKKGFTLMEMLIVVAIIAVLVAIAIPTFNGALTKSKEAADVANIRAAYAEYQVKAISGETVAWDDEGIKKQLNYTEASHGYKYTAAAGNTAAKIEYTATKIKAPDGGDKYTWTLGTTVD
mgnify:CR=1 FL=1